MTQQEDSKLLYTIGEVAEMIGEAPSLIRFWEKEFKVLKPVRSDSGTRKYTKEEIAKIQLIHHLVKIKGLTLEGARAYLKNSKKGIEEAQVLHKLKEVRKFLSDLRDTLSE